MNTSSKKISAVVIAYNDEPNMRACLESLSWVDELIVVDSHSTDATTAISLEFTDQVYQHDFAGFGKLRNEAIAHASHDWVFSLDTDERATPEIRDEIRKALDLGPQADAYMIPRRNFFMGRWIRRCGWYPDYRQPQLFRKSCMKYKEDLVHESYELDGVLGYLHEHVDQIPFRNIDQYLIKMDRYSSLRAEDMSKRNQNFHWHQLITHPIFTFFKMYVLRQGFRDRKPGLILSGLYAYYTFVKYAKLWEIIRNPLGGREKRLQGPV